MGEGATVGLIGLGVMGQNLALNIAERGHRILVFNRSPERMEQFVAGDEAKRFGLGGRATIEEFVADLERPRSIILMVQAGAATDAQIGALMPLLEAGDLIIDGGNAHYPDTIRREQALEERGLLFLGCGISGGEEGARHGPSLMAGGAAEAYERVRPVLESIAAVVDGEPCCTHCGPGGSGHFVKMLHNGIEYADMQLIAEIYALMKDGLGLSYPDMQAAFAEWNRGELDSYLIEITAEILGRTDPETGEPMVEVILDRAGMKGTGNWSVVAALDQGVPAPTIAEAVAARSLSARKDERVRAAEVLGGRAPAGAADVDLDALRDALLAAKICAYAQGFAVLDAAGRAHGWDLDLGRIAAIWRGGCIIRARFLNRIREAYGRDAALPNLMLDPYFRDRLRGGEAAWRRVAGMAVARGLPAPGITSALAYFDGYRSARLPANLLQAQRDYFGAHTYERVDRPGVFHTEWSAG